MAEEETYKKSPFINLQDKNGDGLNDKCDDLITVVDGFKCPECQPNPNYITPNWRKKDEPASWFNEKFCKYQVMIPTGIRTLISSDYDSNEDFVNSIFAAAAQEATDELIDNFNKEYTDESVAAVLEALEYQKYDLDPSPMSYLKLLYSLPYEVLDSLKAAEDDEEEEEEEEEDTSPIIVEMEADFIQSKMIKFRKAMNLYARYYRVMSVVNNGHLVWDAGPNQGAKWTATSFSRYGDSGLFPNSIMADVVKELDNFLNGKGLNIFGVGGIAFGKDRVIKLEFKWNSKYKLVKLSAYTIGCGEKPKVFKKRQLKSLNRTQSYKDTIAMAYFSQLNTIDSRLSGREAPDWTEFVKEFTKPAVIDDFNWPGDFGDTPETALSCVGDSLSEQGKQLGEDIMDDIFGIGDAIAYQFSSNICKKSIGDEVDEEVKLGTRIDPNSGVPKNLLSMASEQAFKELEEDEAVFVSLCASMLSGFGGGNLNISTTKFLDMIYAEGLDRIKLCGLMDMMMDTIGCLMGGLELEDALSRIIKSALKAMSIDNLGDFFIGLPPEKQAELEALVQKKIESGDIFKDASGAAIDGGPQVRSDKIAGKVTWKKPWSKESKAENKKDTSQTGVMTLEEQKNSSVLTRRTLAQQFDVGTAAEGELSPNVVLEAYILALLDVYKDDLLSVVDFLNKYPGSQLIAKLIALGDCPRPPIFDPNFLDFIKDIDLPWCRNTNGITLPMLSNPFGWIPKFKDLTAALWEALILAINKAVISIIMKILVKLCELLGGAICKALEAAGSIVASLPAIATGRSTFSEAINQAICGGDASDEQVNDTIAEMFEKLGAGGAALADKDAVIAFTEDVSSFATQKEMMNAFDGNMSDEMATGMYQILRYEHTQFADAFPTKDSLKDFMSDVGSLFPEDIKATMKDLLDNPLDEDYPANPSLCASPQQLEDFQDLRCTLLEGRASPEQCRQMFDDLQDEMGDDLESFASFMNHPMNPDDILPPLVSSPGCDDGLLPFESDEQKTAARVGLSSGLESLKKDFADDMLGNGGFLGWGTWGFINMILSDTMGNPLTNHYRKSFNQSKYVDFITTGDEPSEDTLWFLNDPASTARQRGNFPTKVAPWLQNELIDLEVNFVSKNSFREKTTKKIMFEDPGNMISIPDMGYGRSFSPTTKDGEPAIKVTTSGRKDGADLKIGFRDNNKGKREHDDTPWLYGFDMKVFLSELEEDSDGKVSTMGSYYAPVDATRIHINELYNPSAGSNSDMKAMLSDEEWKDFKKENKGEEDTVSERLFEFVAIDDTLDNIKYAGAGQNLSALPGQSEPFAQGSEYSRFSQCFEQKKDKIPQIVLLREMLQQNNSGMTIPSETALKGFYDTYMGIMFKTFAKEIADNENAFKYGAKIDSLLKKDADYLVKADQTDSPAGTPYKDATVDGENITNDDMILGVSADQLRNGDDARVYYLDPKIYGGSYQNPAVYVKPLKNDGWLGFIDVLFPDYSPCKPRSTDLVDFGSIQKEVSDTYNSIPEDQRLQSDPNCVTELPYNRILERPGKANIQGLIKAACRIYGTVHFIKSMPTFATFKPDFKNVYSNIYAQYIVEVMEKSLRDSQKAFWELFNPFKDDEFWYAFLEQSVQTYGRLVDDGTIIDPPDSVLQALLRINDAQESYSYPYIEAVEPAHEVGETDAPYRWPLKKRGLKLYRAEKAFEFVQATEEDAKLVLKEMVLTELQTMGDILVKNMGTIGMAPKFTNLSYYLFTNLSLGGISLDLDKEIIEESDTLPDSGDEHYTGGGEFSTPDGEEYTGYYHVARDDDDNIIYMTGEFHVEDEHEELNPFANKIVVPIGDIEEYGFNPVIATPVSDTAGAAMDAAQVVVDAAQGRVNSASALTRGALQAALDLAIAAYNEVLASFGISTESIAAVNTPFVLEKYISINGTKYKTSAAIERIKSNDTNLNISDVYPGDLRLVYPLGQDGEELTGNDPIGITGNLGIRYGAQISIMINGEKYLVADAEEDAVDTKIGQIAPLEKNSKLLLCVINKLREDDRFKLLSEYVFPMKKITSILAVYNDLGFLPSIGEKTVEDGDTIKNLDSSWNEPDYDTKPGAKVTFPNAPDNFDPEYGGNDNWASAGDRSPPMFSFFVTQWDEWDRILLKNSKSRLKKLFKDDYYSRDFNANEAEPPDFVGIFMGNLKESLKPASGKRIFPWFKRRNLVSNPFNSKGELCSKKD